MSAASATAWARHFRRHNAALVQYDSRWYVRHDDGTIFCVLQRVAVGLADHGWLAACGGGVYRVRNKKEAP